MLFREFWLVFYKYTNLNILNNISKCCAWTITLWNANFVLINSIKDTKWNNLITILSFLTMNILLVIFYFILEKKMSIIHLIVKTVFWGSNHTWHLWLFILYYHYSKHQWQLILKLDKCFYFYVFRSLHWI